MKNFLTSQRFRVVIELSLFAKKIVGLTLCLSIIRLGALAKSGTFRKSTNEAAWLNFAAPKRISHSPLRVWFLRVGNIFITRLEWHFLSKIVFFQPWEGFSVFSSRFASLQLGNKSPQLTMTSISCENVRIAPVESSEFR